MKKSISEKQLTKACGCKINLSERIPQNLADEQRLTMCPKCADKNGLPKSHIAQLALLGKA